MRMEMRMRGRSFRESVQGLIELARVATGADGDQRQPPRITRRVRACRRGHEAAQLGQRVVQDVGQPVAVPDQVLDRIKPSAFATAVALTGTSR
jgi:hypothetical protein